VVNLMMATVGYDSSFMKSIILLMMATVGYNSSFMKSVILLIVGRNIKSSASASCKGFRRFRPRDIM